MSTIKRLYEKFQPSHYDVFIDIDREKKTITGNTTITGNASEPQISVNQKFLTISSVQIAGEDVPLHSK